MGNKRKGTNKNDFSHPMMASYLLKILSIKFIGWLLHYLL